MEVQHILRLKIKADSELILMIELVNKNIKIVIISLFNMVKIKQKV